MKSNELRHTQAELVRNLERCPKFERCNRNLCPLDYELERRYGGAKCRWMQEGDAKPIKTGVATFPGLGAPMPDDLLIHVPEKNVSRLNGRSRERWDELRAGSDAQNGPEGVKSCSRMAERNSDE